MFNTEHAKNQFAKIAYSYPHMMWIFFMVK